MRLLATRTAFFFLFFSFLSFPLSIARAILSQQRPGWAVGSALRVLLPWCHGTAQAMLSAGAMPHVPPCSQPLALLLNPKLMCRAQRCWEDATGVSLMLVGGEF